MGVPQKSLLRKITFCNASVGYPATQTLKFFRYDRVLPIHKRNNTRRITLVRNRPTVDPNRPYAVRVIILCLEKPKTMQKWLAFEFDIIHFPLQIWIKLVKFDEEGRHLCHDIVDALHLYMMRMTEALIHKTINLAEL